MDTKSKLSTGKSGCRCQSRRSLRSLAASLAHLVLHPSDFRLSFGSSHSCHNSPLPLPPDKTPQPCITRRTALLLMHTPPLGWLPLAAPHRRRRPSRTLASWPWEHRRDSTTISDGRCCNVWRRSIPHWRKHGTPSRPRMGPLANW